MNCNKSENDLIGGDGEPMQQLLACLRGLTNYNVLVTARAEKRSAPAIRSFGSGPRLAEMSRNSTNSKHCVGKTHPSPPCGLFRLWDSMAISMPVDLWQGIHTAGVKSAFMPSLFQ